jgi:hypothetical protein
MQPRPNNSSHDVETRFKQRGPVGSANVMASDALALPGAAPVNTKFRVFAADRSPRLGSATLPRPGPEVNGHRKSDAKKTMQEVAVSSRTDSHMESPPRQKPLALPPIVAYLGGRLADTERPIEGRNATRAGRGLYEPLRDLQNSDCGTIRAPLRF